MGDVPYKIFDCLGNLDVLWPEFADLVFCFVCYKVIFLGQLNVLFSVPEFLNAIQVLLVMLV